jgi:hypothetical protein
MLQTYVSSVSDVLEICCNLFHIGVAKVGHDVAKVDRDVANVAMAMHVCFKCMFQMFYLYQMYVVSVFIRMLQKYIWMLHIHTCCNNMFSVVSYVCCKCFIWMLYMFAVVFKCFYKCFRRMFQVFYLSFFCMLQLLLLDVLKVNRVLHMGCVGDVRGSAGNIQDDADPAARALARKADVLWCSLAHLAPHLDDQIGRLDASESGLIFRDNTNKDACSHIYIQ